MNVILIFKDELDFKIAKKSFDKIELQSDNLVFVYTSKIFKKVLFVYNIRQEDWKKFNTFNYNFTYDFVEDHFMREFKNQHIFNDIIYYYAFEYQNKRGA